MTSLILLKAGLRGFRDGLLVVACIKYIWGL